MPESMHERYERDEQRLIDSAKDELWMTALVDAAVDVAAPIMAATQWHGVPDGAPARWVERVTAASALMAMALRTMRVATLTIRAGYAPEALAHLRRLTEAAGHAQEIAEDASGEYAANWLEGRGKADKPRVAFGADTRGLLWRFMSAQSHAGSGGVNMVSSIDEAKRIIHSVGPQRDPRDNIWLWIAARQFLRVMACVLKVNPAADQTDFLLVGTRVSEAWGRIEGEIEDYSNQQ